MKYRGCCLEKSQQPLLLMYLLKTNVNQIKWIEMGMFVIVWSRQGILAHLSRKLEQWPVHENDTFRFSEPKDHNAVQTTTIACDGLTLTGGRPGDTLKHATKSIGLADTSEFSSPSWFRSPAVQRSRLARKN